ncbi:hypothetical protein [Stenotrophomonas maltophilia]|uniref:hypothetical protein n=1 Tax=Stenotrophomonas maltophilia TaxID=40324 RepID=UPI003BF819A5
MFDMGSITTAVGSVGTAIGMAKTALELRDFNASAAAISDASQKVINLQTQLLSALGTLFELQQERAALAQRVRELEEHRSDRERYSLFEITPGGFVYRLNVSPETAGTGQPGGVQSTHYLCQPCLDVRGHKVVLNERAVIWYCPECKASVDNGKTVNVDPLPGFYP